MAKIINKSIALLIAPIALFGCDDEASRDFSGADPATLSTPVGKADVAEVAVSAHGAWDVLQLQGDAAKDMFAVMDAAGGFTSASNGSLDYLYGYYFACVSNGEAAACNVYSRDARLGDGQDLLATLHGARFDSAASELFGAVARAGGVHPAGVDSIASRRLACAKSSQDVWCGVVPPTPAESVLELSFEGLPALGADFVYEGWLITADGPVTSGRFSWDEGQGVAEMTIDPELAAASTLFVLTIEPAVGDDPAPSKTHIVAGPIVDGKAVLDTAHGAALGSDFLAAAGGFILETPSTAGVADDYGQGVWFLDPAGGPGPSLDLPTLPDGWAYEGWVVGTDGPVSTGRFTDVAAADADGGGPAAGPDGTPPFPGQDFIDPALDLTGGFSVVISVEPDPDDSPLPFALKPLAGPVADAGPGVLQASDNIAASNRITGLATLR